MPAIIGTGAHTCLLSLALEHIHACYHWHWSTYMPATLLALEHIHACYVIVLDLMSCDSENLLQFIGS